MNRVQVSPLSGDFELGNNLETTNDTAATATGLTLNEGEGISGDWVYSATAEDNGIAGALDGTPGITYNGPAGTTGYFRFQVHNADVVWAAEGIADPDAEDTVSLDLYVNSAVVLTSDEGQTATSAEGIAIEFNLTAESIGLSEGDVVRLALTSVAANEATIDWDLNEGGEWSIT